MVNGSSNNLAKQIIQYDHENLQSTKSAEGENSVYCNSLILMLKKNEHKHAT